VCGCYKAIHLVCLVAVPAISLQCLCNGRLVKVDAAAPLYTDVLSKRSWRTEQGREGMTDAILLTESGKVYGMWHAARVPTQGYSSYKQ
jgi:hypothetical protein